MKDNFPYASFFLKENFSKILKNEGEFLLPKCEGDKGELLTPGLMLLLGLNNNKILNCPRVEKLYSSITNGTSFRKLIYEIKGYDAPIIFIIKNGYNTVEKFVYKVRQCGSIWRFY